MSSLELKIREAASWLQTEALRYVLIAQDHAGRAELITHGTDKIPAQPKRGGDLQRVAQEAKALAAQFLGYAQAVTALAPPRGDLEHGAATFLPATFLRRCSDEDYPGEGLFRLPSGEVVRAALAPHPEPEATSGADGDAALPQLRSA